MTTLDEINEYEGSPDRGERKQLRRIARREGYNQMIYAFLAYLRNPNRGMKQFRKCSHFLIEELMEELAYREDELWNQAYFCGTNTLINGLIYYLKCSMKERESLELFDFGNSPQLKELLQILEN